MVLHLQNYIEKNNCLKYSQDCISLENSALLNQNCWSPQILYGDIGTLRAGPDQVFCLLPVLQYLESSQFLVPHILLLISFKLYKIFSTLNRNIFLHDDWGTTQ